MKSFFGLLLSFILFSGNKLESQSIFSDLQAIQYSDSILINWTLNGGFTCTNMELQRSTDKNLFEAVYKVSGTCGASSDQYYSYVDSETLNNGKIYYYRIAASGEFFVSNTVSVLFVNAGEEEIFVYPNPTGETVNCTVDNKYTPPFLIEIYSAEGRQMNSSEMVPTNNFILHKGSLQEGWYILKITTTDRVVLSKSILVTGSQ